jgi:hypothetical protein
MRLPWTFFFFIGRSPLSRMSFSSLSAFGRMFMCPGRESNPHSRHAAPLGVLRVISHPVGAEFVPLIPLFSGGMRRGVLTQLGVAGYASALGSC